MPAFTQSPSLITVQEVLAFEHRAELCLPEDYKQFLLKINGGVPNPNRFTVAGCGDALVDFLYGLSDPAKPGDLEYELARASELNPLPAGFLPIGHDPGGNILILATLDEDRGHIFYWDSAGFWGTGRQNTFLVATTFIGFLDSLSESN